MKKLLSTIIVLLLVSLSVCGCAPKFAVQYVPVAWNESMNGKHQLFQNRQQLDEFIENYEYADNDFATFSNLLYNHRGEPTAFSTAIKRYDDAFFQDSVVVLISLEEGSGSISHKVKSCELTNDSIVIDLDTYTPTILTDDMALWHILIEIEKGDDYDFTNKTILLNNVIKHKI